MEVYNVETSEEELSDLNSAEYDDDVDNFDIPEDEETIDNNDDDFGPTSRRVAVPVVASAVPKQPMMDSASQCGDQERDPFVRQAMSALLTTLGAPIPKVPTCNSSGASVSHAFRAARRICSSLVPPPLATHELNINQLQEVAASSHIDVLAALNNIKELLQASVSFGANPTAPCTPLSPLPPSSENSFNANNASHVLQQLFQQLAAHMSVALRDSVGSSIPTKVRSVMPAGAPSTTSASNEEHTQQMVVHPELEGILKRERVDSITTLYQELLQLREQATSGQAADKVTWATTALEANCRQLALELKSLEQHRSALFRTVTHNDAKVQAADIEITLESLCRAGTRLREEQRGVAALLSTLRSCAHRVGHQSSPQATVFTSSPQVHDLQREEIRKLTRENLQLQDKLRILEERAERAERSASEAARSIGSQAEVMDRIMAKVDTSLADQRANDMKLMANISSLLIGRHITNIGVTDVTQCVVAVDRLDGASGDLPEAILLDLSEGADNRHVALTLAAALLADNAAKLAQAAVPPPMVALDTKEPSADHDGDDIAAEEAGNAATSLFYDDFGDADDTSQKEDVEVDEVEEVAVTQPAEESAHIDEPLAQNEDVSGESSTAAPLLDESEAVPSPAINEEVSVDDEAATDEDVLVVKVQEEPAINVDSPVEPVSPFPREIPEEVSFASSPSRKRSRSVSPEQRRAPSARFELQPTEVNLHEAQIDNEGECDEKEVVVAAEAAPTVVDDQVTTVVLQPPMPLKPEPLETVIISTDTIVADTAVDADKATPEPQSVDAHVSPSKEHDDMKQESNLFAEEGFWED
ncbi:Hypothetical protein, putative [Bodo saltans]|uniref:Uncharacterized protein n=1 Tax=Bodo saltans TaxID=75058 RepID=A0A0S4JMQ0_BODSA|nr:Hypothetical protein, putative [Bodo saltans]|eukprot:CUG90676.1 Hypothetical protein, putative [Bodo saltans]